jgi:hypothetical protein
MGMSPKAMNMAKAGRAMKSATPDMMGRAMARPPGMKKGGDTKEMMKKEVAFMKKKGAPKSMIRHEEKEYGMKKGVKKMSAGGSFRSVADGIASKGKTKGKMVRMNYGGKC